MFMGIFLKYRWVRIGTLLFYGAQHHMGWFRGCKFLSDHSDNESAGGGIDRVLVHHVDL